MVHRRCRRHHGIDCALCVVETNTMNLLPLLVFILALAGCCSAKRETVDVDALNCKSQRDLQMQLDRTSNNPTNRN